MRVCTVAALVGLGGCDLTSKPTDVATRDPFVDGVGGDADTDSDADSDSDADADADSDSDADADSDTDTDSDADADTVDTATTPVGPTVLDSFESDCGSSTTTWTMVLRTEGFTDGSALVYQMETANSPPWDEEHDVPRVGSDATGEDLEASLSDQSGFSTWTPGVATAFACGVHDSPAIMTWVVRIYDVNGVLADCWITGHDPAGMQSGAYDALMINGLVDPAERSACALVP